MKANALIYLSTKAYVAKSLHNFFKHRIDVGFFLVHIGKVSGFKKGNMSIKLRSFSENSKTNSYYVQLKKRKLH